MPQYGRIQFGRHQYGKYLLLTSERGAIGPHVRYRIRNRSSNGQVSDFLTMFAERIEIPSSYPLRIRMRTNNGDWVFTQNETIQADASRVRIRSVSKDGTHSEWVYGVYGNLSKM